MQGGLKGRKVANSRQRRRKGRNLQGERAEQLGLPEIVCNEPSERPYNSDWSNKIQEDISPEEIDKNANLGHSTRKTRLESDLSIDLPERANVLKPMDPFSHSPHLGRERPFSPPSVHLLSPFSLSEHDALSLGSPLHSQARNAEAAFDAGV